MPLGDVNRDGKITMSDANMIVNMFLSGESRYDDMADVNNDMTISMSDANMVVNMFLSSKE